MLRLTLKILKVTLKQLLKNIKNINTDYAVVKADCYGHGMSIVPEIIESGANYLAVF